MLSCALIAGDEAGMQRDYWYESVRSAGDFPDAARSGRKAAERTLARLGARRLSHAQVSGAVRAGSRARTDRPSRVAVSGGALYRKASFLRRPRRQEDPSRFRRHRRTAAICCAAKARRRSTPKAWRRASATGRGGVLQRYVLGSYSARKLGLESTGNAGGIHNLVVKTGGDDFAPCCRALGTGLLVTEVMGQGVSIITGDYSRGASGFWVENGEIVHPVEEITIAANLRDMFAGIVAIGADVDPRSHILTGSILHRQDDDRRRIDVGHALMRARNARTVLAVNQESVHECSAE